MNSARTQQFLRAALAVVMLPVLFFTQRGLERDRLALGLRQPHELDNAPPLLAFVTAAGGGFRGVVANTLWIRATKLQDEGRYFELYTLSDWITKLQPDFASVWAVQSWNMSYNISRQFSEPADRWLWVRSGMELLRDEGLRYNPRDPVLFRELAWLFQDKIGKYTDDAHSHYKQTWAAEMREVLGPDLKPEALLNPKTEDARRRADILRRKYKLFPEWMQHVDEHYGPLDWRLPESHAIYWADLGLSRCDPKSADVLPLRRVLWQSMQMSFLRGRLIEKTAERRIDFGPNLDLVTRANATYEEMRKAEPERAHQIVTAQKNFLKDAIYLLYAHGRQREAAQWLHYARAQFPDLIPARQTLDEFAVAEVTGDLASANPMRVRGLLEGIVGHVLRCQANGEDEEASGHALLARRMWEFYATKHAGQSNVALPSLAEMEKIARQQMAANATTKVSTTNAPAPSPRTNEK